MRKLKMCIAVLGVSSLLGCVLVSPLESPDPEIRRQAVENVTDDQELFFIAMNIGVCIGSNPGLYRAEYPEDVRVMAVRRIKNASFLLMCASWKDNDLYEDAAAESGCFEYKGERHYRNENRKAYMTQKVSQGDAVRKAAAECLATPEMLKEAAQCFDKDARKTLFPSATHWTGSGYSSSGETSFVDIYGNVRKNNPLDEVLTAIVEKETTTASIAAFVYNASESGPEIVPNAYNRAIHRLDGISSTDAAALFNKVVLGIDTSNGSDSGVRKTHASGTRRDNVPLDWALEIYRHIDAPTEEVVSAAIEGAPIADVVKILSKVKQASIFPRIFSRKDFVKQVPNDKRTTLRGAHGSVYEDVKPEVAKELLAPVNDQEALSQIALGAGLFSIRQAAIEKLSDDSMLRKVASDKMSDCPYDTTLEGFGWGNGVKWMIETQEAGVGRLKRLAISRMKDVAALKNVRKDSDEESIKKAVSERLSALGFSDVDEIIACEKYDKDLFSMFAELKNPDELSLVSEKAKLKGVRLLAASKRDATAFAAVAKKEMQTAAIKPTEGRIAVGGFYLGMGIEDMFAKLAAEYPNVKPTLYLDGKALCIAGGDGRDIAWSDAKSLDVHWITLPPSIVKKIAGFKTGSFDDLKQAVEKNLGVSFGRDIIRKGSVSQIIGNLENTEGETLRYFIGGIGEGEDFCRTVRKAVNRNSAGNSPLDASVAGLSNAIEDAMQADENRANAKRPMFQLPGSLQLQRTENAAKGTLNSKGSFRK